MVSKDISEKEVREKLEEAVKNFDWITEFFPHLDRFISRYKLLSAQLKEKDELEIKIKKKENRSNRVTYAEPEVDIILTKEKGKSELVYSISYDGTSLGSELLYND